MSDKVLNLLGLACRAGKAVCGDGAAQKTLKRRRVPLLFLASDGGSDNVDASVFAPFDYVALGHLHGPQQVR